VSGWGVADPIGSPVLQALEAAWEDIRQRHPDVPPAVMVLASGSAGRSLKLGHFAALRWVRGSDELAEVLVGGEGLRRGGRDVLGTLVHEAAHGLATARNVADTSRGGRYHNARYRDLARSLGLSCEQAGSFGWTETDVPDGLATRYQTTLDRLDEALVVYRRAESPRRSKRSTNYLPLCCSCGRRIRAAASVAAAGPIICGCCRDPFVPVDGGPDVDG